MSMLQIVESVYIKYEILRFHSISDSKIMKQISLLCHLLPPKGRLVVKKKSWKFSIQECVDSIIIHAFVSIIRNYTKVCCPQFSSSRYLNIFYFMTKCSRY